MTAATNRPRKLVEAWRSLMLLDIPLPPVWELLRLLATPPAVSDPIDSQPSASNRVVIMAAHAILDFLSTISRNTSNLEEVLQIYRSHDTFLLQSFFREAFDRTAGVTSCIFRESSCHPAAGRGQGTDPLSRSGTVFHSTALSSVKVVHQI